MRIPTHVVACAHGTDDPRGRALIDGLRADLAAVLAARGARATVHEAYVDVQGPALGEVLAGLPAGEPAVVAPLLLSTGHHTEADIADAAAARPATAAAAPIGPDPRLAGLLAARLRAAGLRDGDRVVLAAAGTRNRRGLEEVRRMAGLLAAQTGHPVEAAFGAAAGPGVAEAVAAARALPGTPRVLVAPYLLAPGFFHGRLAGAGADAVAAPLLPSRHIAECVADRLAEAPEMTPRV